MRTLLALAPNQRARPNHKDVCDHGDDAKDEQDPFQAKRARRGMVPSPER